MDFQTLTRRQLQALCKKNKIPANLTNVAMANSLKALDIVEGIEEILMDQSEKSNIETPIAPRTGCRSSARRMPNREDSVSTKIMTRAQLGTKLNATLDVSKTPAGRSCRRRAPEIEKKDLPETPMETTARRLTRATRSSVGMGMESLVAGNQMVETSTKKVYSTRRNTRLLEKKMMELNLIGDDEIEPAKIHVASDSVVQLLDDEVTESQPIDEEVLSKVETHEEFEEDVQDRKGDEDILGKIQNAEKTEEVDDDVQEVEETEEDVHVSEMETYEVSDHSLNVEPNFEGLEEDIQESKGDEVILTKTLESEVVSIQVTDVQLEEIEEVEETEEDAHVSEMESYEVSDQGLNVDPNFEELKEDIQESKGDEDIVSQTYDVQPEETEVVEDDHQKVEETEVVEDDHQKVEETEVVEDDYQKVEETKEVEDDVQEIEETEDGVQKVEENEDEDDVKEIEETEEVEDDVQKVKVTEEVEDDVQDIEIIEEVEDHVQEIEETEDDVQKVEDDVQEIEEIQDDDQKIEEVEDGVQKVEANVQEIEETEEVEDDIQKVEEIEEVEDDVQKVKGTEVVDDDVQQEIEETEEVEDDVQQEIEETEEDVHVTEMESYEVFDQTLNAEPDVEEAKDNVHQEGTKEVEDLVSKIENWDVPSLNSNVQADAVEEFKDDVESHKPDEIQTDNITKLLQQNIDEDESKANEGFHVSMTQLEDKFNKALQLNDEIIEKGSDDLVTEESDGEKMIDIGYSFSKNQIEKSPSKPPPSLSSHLTAGLVASVISPFKKPAATSGLESFHILDVNEEEKNNENRNGKKLELTTTDQVLKVKKNEVVMTKDYSICSLRQLKKEVKQIAAVNIKEKKNAASEQVANVARPALQVLSENQVVGAATELEMMGN